MLLHGFTAANSAGLQSNATSISLSSLPLDRFVSSIVMYRDNFCLELSLTSPHPNFSPVIRCIRQSPRHPRFAISVVMQYNISPELEILESNPVNHDFHEKNMSLENLSKWHHAAALTNCIFLHQTCCLFSQQKKSDVGMSTLHINILTSHLLLFTTEDRSYKG